MPLQYALTINGEVYVEDPSALGHAPANIQENGMITFVKIEIGSPPVLDLNLTLMFTDLEKFDPLHC